MKEIMDIKNKLQEEKMKTEQEKEIAREKSREWYQNNKEYWKAHVKEKQKENNYAYEKTEKQRKLRNIKRSTRQKYPIKDEKCRMCFGKATERHHHTNPIDKDKFLFVCHDCHMDLDHQKKYGTR